MLTPATESALAITTLIMILIGGQVSPRKTLAVIFIIALAVGAGSYLYLNPLNTCR